jgi:hypothetical protein
MALTASEQAASVASIEALQLADGLILWTPGGHADPWNHVETAMALDAGGSHDAARSAYSWLRDNQRADGSWHQYYTADGVKDPKFDANTIAYVAAGSWHHWLCTGDTDWLASMWPTIRAAISWVLELQQPTGEILWAREPDGTPFHYALITGSSSIHHSLRAAVAIAQQLGHDASVWLAAHDLLAHALSEHPLEFFAEKDRWAMDWYYPVLGGIHTGAAGEVQLRKRWDDFVIAGEGVRCVNDHPWVTTGETAEAAIACAVAGLWDDAAELFATTAKLRFEDGSYWTGLHIPTRTNFPEGERTAYSAASVLLANAVLTDHQPTRRLFGIQ